MRGARTALRYFSLFLFGGSIRAHPRAAELVAEALPRLGGERGAYCQVMAMAGWTSVPWLPLPRHPQLLLTGDQDPVVPQINARILHSLIPCSWLYIYDVRQPAPATRASELCELVAASLTDETL